LQARFSGGKEKFYPFPNLSSRPFGNYFFSLSLPSYRKNTKDKKYALRCLIKEKQLSRFGQPDCHSRSSSFSGAKGNYTGGFAPRQALHPIFSILFFEIVARRDKKTRFHLETYIKRNKPLLHIFLHSSRPFLI
jgi:hypothetical protein